MFLSLVMLTPTTYRPRGALPPNAQNNVLQVMREYIKMMLVKLQITGRCFGF
jgi:hypothetical protein